MSAALLRTSKLANFVRRGLLAQTEADRLTKVTPKIMKGLAVRPSKDVAGLNKTEAAFLAKLRSDKWRWIGVQAVTLKLGDDCRYTPDFITICDAHIVAWEVKGFWRDDARVKIKAAARQFPFIQFIAVSAADRKFTAWNEEDIAP